MNPSEGMALIAPPPLLEYLEQGVVEEAQRRQRRRRRAVGAAVLAAVLLGIGAYVGFGRVDNGRRSSGQLPLARSSVPLAAPATVFARDPYMGVACHIPNSIACDRVGLAVWLRRPAVAVSATVAGAPLKLQDPTWSRTERRGRKTVFVYAGFLQPAGIVTRLHVAPDPGGMTWMAHPGPGTSSMTGGPAGPSPTVRFRIDFGHGRIVFTELRVDLSSGWG